MTTIIKPVKIINSNASHLPQLKPTTTPKLVPLSVEKIAVICDPYLKSHNISVRSVSAKISVSLTDKPDVLSIQNAKIYQRNKLIIDTDDLSTIYGGKSIYDLKSLHLTQTKIDLLSKVKTNSSNDYTLYIPSFEMKRCRRRGAKCSFPYLTCEFIATEEEDLEEQSQ